MSGFRKKAWSALVALVAVTTVAAGSPHLDCRCPTGEVKRFRAGRCGAATCCCRGRCCAKSPTQPVRPVRCAVDSPARCPCCAKARAPAPNNGGAVDLAKESAGRAAPGHGSPATSPAEAPVPFIPSPRPSRLREAILSVPPDDLVTRLRRLLI